MIVGQGKLGGARGAAAITMPEAGLAVEGKRLRVMGAQRCVAQAVWTFTIPGKALADLPFDLLLEGPSRELSATLSLATRCEFRLHEADAHLGYARLALAEGKPNAAQEHVAKAKAIIEMTGCHRRDGEAEELERLLAQVSGRCDKR